MFFFKFFFSTTFVFIVVEGRLIQPRIVGGKPANFYEFPYMAGLYVKFLNLILILQCGGSIISRNYVVTAAHCVDQASLSKPFKKMPFFIQVGSILSYEGGQFIKVQKIHIHPQFGKEIYLTNDIAVLLLEKSLVFGQAVSKINLPSFNTNPVPGGLLGIATGWGKLSNGSIPAGLQKVSIPTVSLQDCRKSLENVAISNAMFCAGFPKGGRDTCQADSGGPFVVNNILVGITSFGIGCGIPNKPGIYANVAYLREFIDQAMDEDI